MTASECRRCVYGIRMNPYDLRKSGGRFVLVVGVCCALAFAGLPLSAQTDEKKPEEKPGAAAPEKSDKGEKAEKEKAQPPLPPDAHTEQSIQLNGKALRYTVTVGTLPTRDKDGKEAGQVVFTAYTVEGSNRPVTFALNGGPGAASVYLNFGAIGPKRIKFGDQGDSPSDPATLSDNPGTWLDFTDLVFIDPIGTGFSRSLVSADETKKQFYTTDADIFYLSR